MRIRAFQAVLLLSLFVFAGCGGASPSSSAPVSVYIGAADGTVSALNPADGSVRWRYQAACACPADVQALVNGVVYASAALTRSAPTTLYALNVADGSVRWQIKTPGGATFSAIRNDVAYITSSAPKDDPTQYNEMQARSASDGTLLWHTQIDGTGGLTARVADETIYLTSFDSNRYYYDEHRWTALYALNAADGTVRWHRSLGTSDFLLAVANGQLYIDGGVTDIVCDSNVGALNASDGKERWAFPEDTSAGRACTSLIGTGHNLVYGLTLYDNRPAVQSSLYALNASDGSKVWQVDLPGSASDGLLANGTIYLPTTDALVAYSARDGSLLWRAQGENGWVEVFSERGQLALFNGTLYTSISGQRVDALNPATGAVQWRYPTSDDISLTTVANGILYGVISHRITDSLWHQDVVAFNASNGKLLWRFPILTSTDSPIVG